MHICTKYGFSGGAVAKNPPANARDTSDLGLTPGSGRAPGVGSGNSLQDSCPENSMDRGAWRASPCSHKESGMTEQLSMHTHNT